MGIVRDPSGKPLIVEKSGRSTAEIDSPERLQIRNMAGVVIAATPAHYQLSIDCPAIDHCFAASVNHYSMEGVIWQLDHQKVDYKTKLVQPLAEEEKSALQSYVAGTIDRLESWALPRPGINEDNAMNFKQVHDPLKIRLLVYQPYLVCFMLSFLIFMPHCPAREKGNLDFIGRMGALLFISVATGFILSIFTNISFGHKNLYYVVSSIAGGCLASVAFQSIRKRKKAAP